VVWAGGLEWVWLPSARDVAEFLEEEARLRRLPRGELERLTQLAKAAGEFEGMFFEDGEARCLGYYVLWLGPNYRVYVVVAHHSSQPIIEAIDIEEWVTVSRARKLARAELTPAQPP
jgi:hypothetical protein